MIDIDNVEGLILTALDEVNMKKNSCLLDLDQPFFDEN